MTMICFEVAGMRFNYRVAGIAIRDHQVLLNRFADQDYWFLPGGRVEMGETSSEALQREMHEELQEAVQIGPLLWIVEGFFDVEKGRSFHELGFYYRMEIAPESPICLAKEPISTMDGDMQVTFQWFSLAELEEITLYPAFLVQGLQHLPAQVVHLLDRRPSN